MDALVQHGLPGVGGGDTFLAQQFLGDLHIRTDEQGLDVRQNAVAGEAVQNIFAGDLTVDDAEPRIGLGVLGGDLFIAVQNHVHGIVTDGMDGQLQAVAVGFFQQVIEHLLVIDEDALISGSPS